MRCKYILEILILCYIFTSCAYFNTFHNTKKLYKEAIKAREKRSGDKPTSQEIQKYDRAIEKASKILEVYPKSKYVDDAVMILGECLFYKGEYVKAQRKFQELITYFSDSDYFLKARLWLARTNIKLKDYTSARLNLTELLGSQKLESNVRDESRYLLGQTFFEQEKFSEAANEYQTAAIDSKDKLIKAKAYLRLGACQEIDGQYGEAVTSFRKAIKYSPDENLEFDAQLSLCRALKLAGNFNNSRSVCSDLLENTIYQNNRGYVKLEMADCTYREGLALYDKLKGADLEYLGKIEQALDEYKEIALEYKRTEVSAIAYYRMAKIYEEDFGDFAKARDNYTKVRGEYPKSEFVEESTARAKDIDDLLRLNKLVKKSQGEQLAAGGARHYRLTEYELLLLEHGVHPELRFMQRTRKIAKLDPSKLAENDEAGQVSQEKNLDELVANKLQLAEVYLFQFGQIDSALIEYDEIMQFFSEHPAAAKALYSSAFIYENEFHNKAKTDSLLYLLIQKFPDSQQAEDARKKLGLPLRRRTDHAAILFQRAERSLFNRQDVNSAIAFYEEVIEKYSDSEYTPKAMLALGWIYDQIKQDKERAKEIYTEIQTRFPNSEFSDRVGKKLQAVQIETNSPAANGKSEPGKNEAITDEQKRKMLLNEESELAKPEDNKTKKEKKQEKKPIP